MFLITAQQRHHLLPNISPSQHQLNFPQLMDAEPPQIWAYNLFGFFSCLQLNFLLSIIY